MLLLQCPSCDYVNPADSITCNGCKLSLRSVPSHLAPCPFCGALNGAAATPCWACDADLQARSNGFARLLVADRDGSAALPPGSKVSESSALAGGAKTLRRQRLALTIGSAVLATVAVASYSTYRQHSIVDAAGPASTPAAAVDRGSAADDAKEAKADKRVELPVVTPTAKPSTAPATVKRRKTTNAAARIDRQPTSLGPCTEAIAALGLCTPEPTH